MNIKKFLAIFLVSMIFVCPGYVMLQAKEEKTSALKKDKVILPRGHGEYMEVRHLVLRGTNEEIGKALGKLAQKWLNVKLSRYFNPVYARARRSYMKENYPILYERMKGVAKAYDIPFKGNIYDTSNLIYDLGPFACSSLYFPADSTTKNHTLFVRNMDFYIVTMGQILGKKKPLKGEHNLFSRNYVMELYPTDGGYHSLALGSLCLFNGVFDGVNSEGLMVVSLADHNCPTDKVPVSGGSCVGLCKGQLVRLLLDTCKSLEEAKVKLLNSKIAFDFEGFHLQVGDRSGKSFIFEISGKDRKIHFTDNNGKPQIMTNHPVYLYPNVKFFPWVSSIETYNTFYRYRVLYNYLQRHKGKFSDNDVWEYMRHVYAHTEDASEGAALPLPCRTLWKSLFNLNEQSCKVIFYLKDGKIDPTTGDPTLIFSKPFTFKLKSH